jgi:hypothetical protein
MKKNSIEIVPKDLATLVRLTESFRKFNVEGNDKNNETT